MKRNPYRPAELWKVLRTAVREFIDSDTATLGAALSYYTVFSIAPVLIIVISIAGLAFGPQAVEGEIKGQVEGLIGKDGAKQVETMIASAYQPGKGRLATILAAVLLVFTATAVFGQLRTSLNVLWEVKPKPRAGYVKRLLDRIFSFAMAVCIAFLLLVSLVAHAGIVAATRWATGLLPSTEIWLLATLEFVVSFLLTTALFAIVYRFMSDAKVLWRDVWAGSLFTAVLFTVGKYAIGEYLGRSNVADTYGMAGSIVLLLLWVFYSSQILFLGAEFTEAFAEARGSAIAPGSYAVRNLQVEIEKPKTKPEPHRKSHHRRPAHG